MQAMTTTVNDKSRIARSSTYINHTLDEAISVQELKDRGCLKSSGEESQTRIDQRE